jgi:hypothetical protein
VVVGVGDLVVGAVVVGGVIGVVVTGVVVGVVVDVGVVVGFVVVVVGGGTTVGCGGLTGGRLRLESPFRVVDRVAAVSVGGGVIKTVVTAGAGVGDGVAAVADVVL